MSAHDDLREQLADFVFDDVTAEVRARIEAHLRECDACSREVEELRDAFGAVGFGVEPIAPPPTLRDRVLASFPTGSTITPASIPASRAASPAANSRYPAWWMAAAAVVALMLAGGLAIMSQRARVASGEATAARAEVARLSRQARTVEGQADLAVAILTASDVRLIALAGSEGSANAVARAFWSATRGLLIVADRLPAPPPGRQYQVWLIGSAPEPVSAGLLEMPTTGRGMLIVTPPQGTIGDTVTVAVTDEPPGGGPAPTGTKHLVGSS